jgi:hypothetical protein
MKTKIKEETAELLQHGTDQQQRQSRIFSTSGFFHSWFRPLKD